MQNFKMRCYIVKHYTFDFRARAVNARGQNTLTLTFIVDLAFQYNSNAHNQTEQH